jgi:hypothetical protein
VEEEKTVAKGGREVSDKRFCINRVGKLAKYSSCSGVSERLGRQTEERRGNLNVWME